MGTEDPNSLKKDFLWSTHNDDYASSGESSLWVDCKKQQFTNKYELQTSIFKNNKRFE